VQRPEGKGADMMDWNDVRKQQGGIPSPWIGAEPMPAPPAEQQKPVEADVTSFFLGKFLSGYGWVGPRLQPRMWACRCPSERLHATGARFDGSTRLCAPDKRYPHGRILCTHPVCKDLWVDNFCTIGNAVERTARSEGL
jgi:hypothetical protein